MIKIYGTSDCIFCKKAKELAENYNLKYESLDVFEHADYVKSLTDQRTVPQITWDERYIGGYAEFAQEIENTIGGYGDGAF